MKDCKECGKSVKPAKGYLGGGVLCNDCTEELIEENTL
jgi:hypothetical protein